MPETPSTPPQPATPSPDADASVPDARRRVLAAPVLLRAVVALVFGAVTVFWGAPPPIGAAICLAGFFVGLAAARAWLLRRESRTPAVASAPTGPSRAVASAGYGLAAAVGLAGAVGLGLMAAPTGTVLGIGGAIAFALTGGADLATGLRGRGRSPLARDEVIAGVVHLGTAVLLPFFAGLGPHAVLGVAGGAAIITGVLLAIAGLSLRHDSAPTAPVA